MDERQGTGLDTLVVLSLIHISEPTRQEAISYAVFCLKKKKKLQYKKEYTIQLSCELVSNSSKISDQHRCISN